MQSLIGNPSRAKSPIRSLRKLKRKALEQNTEHLKNALQGRESFPAAEREIKFMFPNCIIEATPSKESTQENLSRYVNPANQKADPITLRYVKEPLCRKKNPEKWKRKKQQGMERSLGIHKLFSVVTGNHSSSSSSCSPSDSLSFSSSPFLFFSSSVF